MPASKSLDSSDITDTERLDAIESGFCASTNDERTPAGWVRFWTVAYSTDASVVAGTLREALDLAIVARRGLIH